MTFTYLKQKEHTVCLLWKQPFAMWVVHMHSFESLITIVYEYEWVMYIGTSNQQMTVFNQ